MLPSTEGASFHSPGRSPGFAPRKNPASPNGASFSDPVGGCHRHDAQGFTLGARMTPVPGYAPIKRLETRR
jgi:hypothetical protein